MKQLELPLLPPPYSPTIREIQMATRELDLFDIENRWIIIDAVSKLYGIDLNKYSAYTKGIREFANQCYEDAFVAHTAFNPDIGH